jgi:uncharacterized protein (DUF1778 family)
MATISLRVADADLAEIDRRAGCARMTRTAFMLRSALGVATADEERFDGIERRLSRIEEVVFTLR